jgi:hypothetical protein
MSFIVAKYQYNDQIKDDELDYITHMEEKIIHIEFCLENLKEIANLEDTGLDSRILLTCILNRVWSGLIWLRIGSRGGLL